MIVSVGLPTAGDVVVQVDGDVFAEDAVEVQVDDEGAELEAIDYTPGFMLPLAEEDVREQVSEMLGYLDGEDWGRAFRLLSETKEQGLSAMVPVGDDGLHMAVRVPLQQRLLAMPPEGLRAFRLYFDGQAREMLTEIRGHPRPGSIEQLGLAQKLVDRMLASSVGPEAADLLGDLYFERGAYVQADRYWGLSLQYGNATGDTELLLQTKRALALYRAGDHAGAASLYQQLKARYSEATIQLGGSPVNALAMLEQALGPIDPDDVAASARDDAAPITLPGRGDKPVWHLLFLDQKSQAAMSEQRNNRGFYYAGPRDLLQHVPPVVADGERVYFHWLGAVFALDRHTGKIVWTKDSIGEAASTVQQRMNSNAGDPRNYQIALSEQALLVTNSSNGQSGRFTLSAFDKQTGRLLWDSDNAEGWTLPDAGTSSTGLSMLGEVLVRKSVGYAVASRQNETDCYLLRFDPATGSVDWTLRLGAADTVAFQYTEIRRMPQPKLLMGGGLLYVLTNNGGLVAIDLIAEQVAWAMRMQPPAGVGESTGNGRFVVQTNQGSAAPSNVNSIGGLLLRNGLLFAKEDGSKALYAMDPLTGELAWSADSLSADAHLIDADEERFYLMDRHIQCYAAQGDHDLITKNRVGDPSHGGAIRERDQILVYSPGRLRLLDTQHLDPIKTHQSDYLGPNGGRVYRFDDLIICISQREITAFKIKPEPTD